MRRLLATVLVALSVSGTAAVAAGPIRVTLTAENHDPRPSERPSWQWWYCVTVRTAAGTSVPSTIRLRIRSGGTTLARVGLVSLRKGYDRWCADIGGEANVLAALPRGKRLVFQAVVTADGVTVRRSWPLVVR